MCVCLCVCVRNVFGGHECVNMLLTCRVRGQPVGVVAGRCTGVVWDMDTDRTKLGSACRCSVLYV